MPDSTAELTSDELFAPPEVNWQRISPKYKVLRQITALFNLIPFAIVAGVLLLFRVPWWIPALVGAFGVAYTVLQMLLAGRRFRAWGYAELEDDLWVTHGVLFRFLTAVPYGRMQVVEVSSGPIERSMGLATVTMVTASANSNCHIPGLPEAEAARLRDRLSALGDAKASGL
ncbi:PH domain-containing protein [Enemella sp. A6]|uniref:PH domain-containing protein n=1 Tax=Enemella sp. A6 TaxID=3440152 RepID=UPI003EB8A4AD